MHGQADDGVGHAGGVGEVLACSAGQALIGGEGADERVEVAAGKDALFAHLEVELIACHAVLFCIHKDGEVAVVVTHTWHIVPEVDALNGTQRFTVTNSDLVTCFDTCIN